jgi:RHS repeat-associated protein
VPQRWTVYDGSTPYLDLTGTAQVSERYLADPNALAQYWARVGVTGQADWMVTDLLGSVRALVSAGGSVEDQINYDAYGNIVTETNPSAGGRLKYAGGQYDGGLGLTLFGARWYNSAAGRWLSQDPLGLGPDGNPYRYVGNGPTDGTDPSGLVLLDNRERLRTAYAEAMRLQNAYAQANGHAPPLTEAQIQAYSTQAAQGGVYDYEPNPLYNDFWARAYQCEVQIFSDAVPFARGFVAGVGSGAWSFGEGVANLIRGLPGSVGQIIEGITNLIGALVELRWDAAARQAFPDLYRLVSEWSSVGAYDKGYLAGRVVGQYGAAVLTGMGVSRILGMVRRAPLRSRADFHIELRSQGYQYHHTTQGGYVLYRHPNGSQVWIRPNGQVIRTGPPVTPSGGGRPYRPRVDASGNPITTHDPNEFVVPLPGN